MLLDSSACSCVSPHKATYVSGNLGAHRKVPHPLLIEGLPNASSLLLQGSTHSVQRAQWIPIDTFRGHHHYSPAVLIKPFPPFHIMAPLFGVVRMLTPVVLNDQLVLRIAQVKSPTPFATC